MMRWKIIPAFAAAAGLASCAVGPDFHAPAAPSATQITARPLQGNTAVADTAGGSAQVFAPDGDVAADWWTAFHSPVLNSLVADALAANPDLTSAKAALRVADENAAAERAAFFPGLSAGFDGTRQKTSNALSPVLSGPQQTFNLFTAQLSVSYAPDLFGGTRRSVESADALAQGQLFALRAAHLALAGNVVLAAIQVASLQDQIMAQQKIVDDVAQLQALIRDQVAHGAASQAALAGQDTLLAQAQAVMVSLRKQLSQETNLLSALSGKLPAQFQAPTLHLADLSLPREVPVSLPADLVRHRPDVQIAENNLHAANAQVGVAIAAMLPGINLSAGNGSAASAIAALFGPGNGFWSIGAGLLQPLFDGGALLARKRGADAALDKAKADYQSTVVTAFQNTADALEAVRFDAQALSAAATVDNRAATALRRARNQHDLGDIGMPGVLLAEQNFQQAEAGLVQARASRYADMAGLFTALGGGWWHEDNTQHSG